MKLLAVWFRRLLDLCSLGFLPAKACQTPFQCVVLERKLITGGAAASPKSISMSMSSSMI